MHPNVLSTAPGMDHLPQHLAWATMGWIQAAPPAPSPAFVAPGRSRQPDEERLSPFLGRSDNELIHGLFQSHEKRDLLYQGLDVFPLSASEEPAPDNQKNNSQPASSWQAGAQLTARRAQGKCPLSP